MKEWSTSAAGQRKPVGERDSPAGANVCVFRPPQDGVVITKKDVDTDTDISTSISNNASNRRHPS